MNSKNQNENEVRKHFDDRADYWEEIYSQKNFNSYMLRKRRDYVLNLAYKTPLTGRILDLGCGAGSFSHELARRGHTVVGVDIAPKMIEKAKEEAVRKNAKCEFRVGSSDHLDFEAGFFDTVIAVGVLEYVEKQELLLAEIRRVLKKGGRFIVTMPNAWSFYRIAAFPRSIPMILGPKFKLQVREYENKLRRILNRKPKDASLMWLGQAVTEKAFTRHLEQNGFKNLQSIPCAFGPFHPLGFRFINDDQEINDSLKFENWLKKKSWLKKYCSLWVFETEISSSERGKL